MFQRLLRMVTWSGHFSLFENVRISLENFDVQHVLHAAWIPSLGMLLEMLLGSKRSNTGRRAIKDALRRSSLFTKFVLQTLYHQRRLKVESRFYFLLTCSRRSACSRAAALLSIGQQNLLFLTDQMTVNLIFGERFFSIIPRQRRKYVSDVASDPRT